LSRRPANYNTKQGGSVLAYLAARGDEYVTVARMAEHFRSGGNAASRATIYRQLEKLARSGQVRKYAFEGTQGACFRYVEQSEREPDFCHLKCEVCGGILNLKCDEVSQVSRHISETHAFQVNGSKIVFYGRCQACSGKCAEDCASE
jgi:Fur family ferric uptake transcriptional regulator